MGRPGIAVERAPRAPGAHRILVDVHDLDLAQADPRAAAAQQVRAEAPGRFGAGGEDAGVHLDAAGDAEHRGREAEHARQCPARCRRRRQRPPPRRRVRPAPRPPRRVAAASVSPGAAPASTSTVRSSPASASAPIAPGAAITAAPGNAVASAASARRARAAGAGYRPARAGLGEGGGAVRALEPDRATHPGDRVDDQTERTAHAGSEPGPRP